jgi:hypothetical protein
MTIDTSTTPTCPECGFIVFNRRYPKCESCGALLPATLVYTPAERHALISADEERKREKDRLERAPRVADLGASIDDAVLTAAIGLAPE